jgi:hypothetical protein
MKTLLKIGLALGVAVAATMMAEIERAPQKPIAQGVKATVIEGMSAADTQIIPNPNANVMLRITAGAEAIKVTVVTPNAPGGNAIADLENEIGIGETEVMGPFDPTVYNNSKNQLEVKFNKVAGVKMEVYQVSF